MTPEDEIQALYYADQSDRIHHPLAGTPEYLALRERDAQRRLRLRAILVATSISDPETIFQAALIFQHGESIDEVWEAYTYARQAMERGFAPARWLTAASYDRWLIYSGKPQKYGTQFVPDGTRYVLWQYDPTTTDEERAQYEVPSLAHQGERAERMSQTLAQPPMDEAPAWLQTWLKEQSEAK